MKMITEKIDAETKHLEAIRGKTPLVTKQLNKENKLAQLIAQKTSAELVIAELKKKELDKDDAQIAKEEANVRNLEEKIKTARREVDLLKQVGDTFAASFEANMATAFQNIITGAKTMKEAFGDMTKAILNSLAQILAQQAAMTIMTMLPTGLTNPFGRYGGIMSKTGRSFAQGGIPSGPESGYPVTLHGTEAVVPLGNDRHIPVKFEGKAGSAGNVTVNVNMASGETQATGDDSLALGKAIATAVQQEISKQQRPGGTLSPY